LKENKEDPFAEQNLPIAPSGLFECQSTSGLGTIGEVQKSFERFSLRSQ
jgi:hypothetical protein